MAHRLLFVLLMCLSSGCVPLFYEAGGDAGGGGDHVPNIVASNPEFPAGSMDMGITIFKNATDTYTIDVEDKDLDDTLYVHVFADTLQFPVFIAPPVNPGPVDMRTALRKITLMTNGWCAAFQDNTQHYFDVVVADRPFQAETGLPDARTVTLNGESSTRSWTATCQPM